MKSNEVYRQISAIERKISLLPRGGLTTKKIHGKIYFYHRVYINGKRHEIYVRNDDIQDLRKKIGKRKELEVKLKNLKASLSEDTRAKEKNTEDLVSHS